MLGHPCVVDIFRETICRPFILSIERGEVESIDRVPIVLDVFPSYHRVVAVDPYRPVVMRDGEGEDLPINFILALDSTEELDDAPHRKGHAVGVLPICDVERSGATLHLAGQEREVHVVRGHEEGLVPGNEVANEGRQLGELVLSERVSFEPNGVVRLWTGAGEGDRVVPPFVDALDKAFMVLVPECERFRRRNDKP